MRYKAFEGFGVEVYEKVDNQNVLVRVAYFDGIYEMIKFASDLGKNFTCHFITVDKWCRKINDID